MMEGLGYAKYESYKDSGLDWLGPIPEGWGLLRSKFVWRESEGRSLLGNEELLSVSQYHGIVPRMADSRSEDLTGYKLVNKGELVTNIMLAWMGSLGISDHRGIVSPAYAVYELIGDASPHFLGYLYKTAQYLAEFARRSSGVVPSRWRMYTDDFDQVPTLLPTKQEQHAIAAFLDDKCAKIDGAVKIKEDQIVLLRERRQIIIQDAVTRGLNPAAPMKDSGIDWIGQIPAHWEVKRLAAFGRFSKGGGFSKSDLAESGTDAVLYGDIYTQYDFVIDNPVRKVSTKVADQSVLISQGDLLFTGSGETREDIGKCVLFRGLAKAVSGGDVIIFRQSQNNPLFLTYCLNCHGVVEKKAKSSKGEIIVHTYGSALKNIFIPVPPLDEQERIANFIWDGIGKIEAAISMKQDQIAALKEYKTSLINAAVTGKIKVI